MAFHRVAILNLSKTRRDPRVLRISAAIKSLGNQVGVYEMLADGEIKHELLGDIPVHRVAVPGDYSPEAMAEFHKACPAACDVLNACDPLILSFPNTSRAVLKFHRLIELIGQARATLLGGAAPKRSMEQEIAAVRSIMLINLELYKAAVKQRPTIVYANDLDTLLAGYMLKINLGIPLIYDAHEIYPEQLPVHMRSIFWHDFFTALEEILTPHSDGRLTVCDALADYFRYKYNSPGFVTIRNVPSIRYLPDASILERRNDPVKILYHGAYFAYRGLDEIIDAAPMVDNAQFYFRGIGDYQNVLKAKVESDSVGDKVSFVDPVTVTALVPSATDFDVGLNPFVNVCKNTEFALPNKFFEYMMAGLAVASSDLIEMRLLTSKLNIGVLFHDVRPRSIADSLNELVADKDKLAEYRSNAYHAAKSELHWEHECERFIDFWAPYQDLAEESQASGLMSA